MLRWTSLALFYLLATSVLLGGSPAFAQSFQASDIRCSSACMQVVAQPGSPAPPTSPDPALLEKYKALVDRAETMNTADAVTLFLFIEAPASIAKDAADVFLPVGGSLASDLVDKGIAALDRKAKDDVARILQRGLKELEASPDFGFEPATPGEERLARVEGALRKLRALDADERLFDKIDDARQQNELQQSSIRLLTEGLSQLKAQTAQIARDTALNAQQIRALKKNVVDVTGRVAALEQTSADLKKRFQSLVPQVAHPGAAPPSPEDRPAQDALREADAREYARSARKASAQFDAASGILSELGAPEAARAAALASGVTQLAGGLALSTVDPSAILPTVLGGLKLVKAFAGGDAGDGLGKALAQILELQRKILDQLAAIDRKLTQQHAEVINGLAVVNHNVLVNTDWLRQTDVAALHECAWLLHPGSYEPIETPGTGGYLRIGRSTRFGDFSGFVAHATGDAKDHIVPCKASLSTHFAPVEGAIHRVFRLNDAQFVESPSLPRVAQGTLSQRVEAYRTQVVAKNVEFLRAFSDPTKWHILTRAASSVQDLSNLDSGRTPASRPERAYFREYALTPVNPVAVRRYGGWLAGTHVYFELTDGNRPYRRNILLNRRNLDSTGRSLLSWGLVLSDIAVAQESLEHGDFLVPLVYRVWRGASDEELVCGDGDGSAILKRVAEHCDETKHLTPTGRAHAAELRALLVGRPGDDNDPKGGGLLRANPLLARNLLLYAITKRLESSGSNPLAYQVAISSPPSSQILRALLGEGWTVLYSDTAKPAEGLTIGWYTEVSGTKVMLPDAAAVWSGRLAIQPEFAGLLDTRRRLSEEFAGYEFMSTLSASDAATVRSLYSAGLTF